MDGFCTRCCVTVSNLKGTFCCWCGTPLFTRPIDSRSHETDPASNGSLPPANPPFHIEPHQVSNTLSYTHSRFQPPSKYQDGNESSDQQIRDWESVRSFASQSRQAGESLRDLARGAVADDSRLLLNPPHGAPSGPRAMNRRVLTKDKRGRHSQLPPNPPAPSITRPSASVAFRLSRHPGGGDSPPPWCLHCHRADHFANAKCPIQNAKPEIQELDASWETYHRDEPADITQNPTTLIQVSNILHRLVVHFNQFEAFIKTRDGFLLEVSIYLETRVSPSCYQVWQSCMGVCNSATLEYMRDLQSFVHEMRFHLIQNPLFRIMHLDPPSQEILTKAPAAFARALNSQRYEFKKIQIDPRNYKRSLSTLNNHRSVCVGRRERVQSLIVQSTQAESETRELRKIGEAFACLLDCMFDLGPTSRVTYLTPDDFLIPDVTKIREYWQALED